MTVRRRSVTLIAALLSAALTLGVVARLSSAGFSATTTNPSDNWAAGTVVLTDDDTGAALFSTGTDGLLDGGQARTRCVTVTYQGTLTTGIQVRLHAAATGTLSPHLDLTVEEGSGGGAGSCTGFTPTATLYMGTLAGFATTHDTFVRGAGQWAPASNQSRTYRFTTTVQNTPAAQNATATGTFTWEANTAPPEPLPVHRILWLRGKDLGADRTAITSWTDQATGTAQPANATAPTVAAGATPTGGKAAHFAGGGQINVTYRGTRYAASTSQGGWEAYKAEGDLATDAWASDAMPAWLRVTLPTPTVVTSYRLQGRVGAAQQWPKDWAFQGSVDGTAWDTLDTRTGADAALSAPTTFAFANSTAYQYYRLNVTAAAGGGITSIAIFNVGDPTPTQRELWVVLKNDAAGANGRFGTFGATSDYYPYSGDGKIYTSAASANRLSFAPGQALNQWHLLRISNNGATSQVWIDGVNRFTGPSAVGTPASGGLGHINFKGSIAEYLYLDRVSTPEEAEDLITYFNTEHGLAVPSGG